MVLRSNPVPTFLFILQLKNILRSNLKFSTSYGRSTDLKSLFGLLLVSFIWLGEKISLKYLLIGGGHSSLLGPDGVDLYLIKDLKSTSSPKILKHLSD